MSTRCSRSLGTSRSEEHTSELQSPCNLVCRLLLEKKTSTVAVDDLSFEVDTGQLVGFLDPQAGQEHQYDQSRRPTQAIRTHGLRSLLFFFNDTATTEIYTLSLHDALPI